MLTNRSSLAPLTLYSLLSSSSGWPSLKTDPACVYHQLESQCQKQCLVSHCGVVHGLYSFACSVSGHAIIRKRAMKRDTDKPPEREREK